MSELFASGTQVTAIDPSVVYEGAHSFTNPSASQYEWLHHVIPILDGGDEQPSDPPTNRLMCEFGSHGHYLVGKQLSKNFKYLDQSVLEQCRSAYLQHLITNFPSCAIAENHPPHMQHNDLFSLMLRGDGVVSIINEVYVDVCFPISTEVDQTRLNPDGLKDAHGHRHGATKFGLYLSHLVEGELLTWASASLAE